MAGTAQRIGGDYRTSCGSGAICEGFDANLLFSIQSRYRFAIRSGTDGETAQRGWAYFGRPVRMVLGLSCIDVNISGPI